MAHRLRQPTARRRCAVRSTRCPMAAASTSTCAATDARRVDRRRGGEHVAAGDASQHRQRHCARFERRRRLGSARAAGALRRAHTAPDRADASQGCGRISDFDVAPRGQGLHEATIIAIDNHTPGPHGSQSYLVSAGPHTLKVSEQYRAALLLVQQPPAQRAARRRLQDASRSTSRPTRLISSPRASTRSQRDNPANGAYWDPVVWKEVPETCR